MIKRVLSIALALMMVVACFAGITVGADEVSYTAKLGYSTSGWDVSEWGDIVNAEVTGDGTYTLSWDVGDTAAYDAGVFVVDIIGAQAAMDAENKTYKVTAMTITVDGNDVPVDVSKLISGDIEGNGNYRIEIYNLYGAGTADNPPVDASALVINSNLTVSFTIETIDKPADEPTDAPTDAPSEYVAALGLVASDWSTSTDFSENSTVQTTVTGAGTYTLTYEGACLDLGILVVDIVGAAGALELESVSLTIDGNEVAVDVSKVLSGDLEENGNFRIDLHNMYGDTAAAPAVDNTLTVAESLVLTFTVAAAEGTDAPVEPEPSEPTLEFDPAGTYNAYLMLQTPNWTYRNAWNDATGGKDTEYWGNFIYGNETSETYGVVTDAVIAGNGTYTISITDFGTIFADDFATAGQEYFNILGVSTDIPLNDQIQITDVKLIVDGSTRHTQSAYYQNPDTTDYVQMLIQNIWNNDVKEISYYPTPSESMEIQFTVSGFNYDNPDLGGEPEETKPETQPTEPKDDTTKEPGSPIVPIIIAVVVVAVIVVVVVVVSKKKKAN